ncbi:hypothetical protein Tco_0032947 [Tanacetum coccineum]
MVINSPCLIHKKELAIPWQTATGKEFLNPLIVGSLPKTISIQTRSERVSKHSYDLPLGGVNTPRSDEDRIELKELLDLFAFLSKPAESEGFEQIIDFLNATPIKYALTINPTIYASGIEKFWAIVKAITVNGEVQLQALVDKKKVIITESTITRDLCLEDAEGIKCLPNATIFEELTRMGYEKLSQKLTYYKAFFSPQWKFLIHTIMQCLSAKATAWNEFSSTMASALICLATNQKFNFSKYIFESMVKNLDSGSKFLMYLRFVQVFLEQQVGDMSNHKKIFVTPSHSKNFFRNMKKEGKGFSGRVTPLFPTMMVQAQEEMGEGSTALTNTQHTPTITPPSTSQPQKLQPRRKQRKDTMVPQPTKPVADETEENVPTHSNDPLLSDDEASLGDQEDASKQGRKIHNFDVNQDIAMENVQDADMFRVQDLKGDEVIADAATTTTQFEEPSESITITIPIVSSSQPSKIKVQDKAKFNKEERVAREKEEVNASLIAQWNDIQDKKRRKFFAAKREEEKRNKPPTKAQQRSFMCTYLKNMEGWKLKELKNKSFSHIQELFEKAMEKEHEKTKKKKIDDDQEEAKMKKHMEIVLDEEEIADDAIPLATKPPTIIDYKIIKEGKIGYYIIIRANGSAKRYSSVLQMLRNFDREDLETLWKLVKTKHGDTRPEEGYEKLVLLENFNEDYSKCLRLSVEVAVVKVRVTAAKHNLVLVTTAGRVYADREKIKDLSEKG